MARAAHEGGGCAAHQPTAQPRLRRIARHAPCVGLRWSCRYVRGKGRAGLVCGRRRACRSCQHPLRACCGGLLQATSRLRCAHAFKRLAVHPPSPASGGNVASIRHNAGGLCALAKRHCRLRRPASVRAVAPHNPRYVKCPPRQPAAGVRPLRGVFSPARPGRRLRSRCGRYAPSAACSPPSFPSAPKGGSHKQQRSQKNSNGTQHCGAPADRYAFASLRLRVG